MRYRGIVLSPGTRHPEAISGLRGLGPSARPPPPQEHPLGADAAHHHPDHGLRRALRPACGLPGARGGPHLHLAPPPRRPPDPPDLSLGDQVSASGKEVRPGGPGWAGAGRRPAGSSGLRGPTWAWGLDTGTYAPSPSLPSWAPRSGPPLSLVLTSGNVILLCHDQQSHEN